MYLKRVELTGFKSFPEYTEIPLESGITSIVGPNGCGKSNILDSVRWSLGELSAKTLRSKSIADVIFNGTKRLPPASYAQVTLTFDNADRILGMDAAEVSASRKVYRDGTSEYSLNKTNCRLKDIKNLFLGTGIGDDGYSIMEGRMVEFLLTAKAQDRRLLFDEASGAAKFAVKRNEALSKLGRIGMDLDRVRDNIELINTERKHLESQAKKVRLYEKLKEKKAILESQKIIRQLEELTQQIIHIQSQEIEPKTNEFEQKRLQLDQLYAQIEQLEAKRLTMEKVVSQALDAFHEASSQRDLALEKLSHLDDKIAERQQARALSGQECALLTKNTQSLQLELDQVAQELESQKSQIQATLPKEIQSLEALTQQGKILDKRRCEAKNQIDTLKQQTLTLSQTLTELKNNSVNLNAEILEIQADLKVALKEHERANAEKRQLEITLEQSRRQLQETRAALYGIQEEANSLGRQRQELADKKRSLETTLYRELPQEESTLEAKLKHWDELATQNMTLRGMQEIARLQNDTAGLYGPLGKLIATSNAYYPYLKELLGDKLHWFLAENAETAQAAIDHLKINKKGRVGFIILDRVGESAPSSNGDFLPRNASGKIIDLESILGSTDIRTKKAIAFLLGPTFLKSSVIYKEAIICGGEEIDQIQTTQALTAIQEREALVNALAITKKRQQETNAQLQTLDEQISVVTKHLEELTQQLQEKNFNVSVHAQTETKATNELSLYQESIVATQSDIAQKLGLAAEKKQTVEDLRVGIEHNQITLERAQQALKQEEMEFEQLLSQENKFHEEELSQTLLVTQAKQTLAVLQERQTQLNKEYKHQEANLKKAQEHQETLESEIKRLQHQRQEAQQEHEELESQKEEKARHLGQVKQNQEEQNQKLLKLRNQETIIEEEFNVLESQLRDFELNLKTMEFEKNKTREEAAKLFNIACDELDKKLEEVKTQQPPLDEGTNIEMALMALNQKIERLGQINFMAQEEYQRLDERVNFLNSQRDDILKARDDVRSAIEEINKQIEESFQITFDAVRAKFREIFGQLFTGGEADLILVDSHEPNEPKGVDILAQPPGKKLQNITLLSQGEKALTAISLLFAFFATKPAPVCILDEVDAPLDENNVLRFRKLLETFSQRCQFLVITHNKKTMEAAKALYGVTMEELGVSKIISVKLQEAVEVAAA